MNLINERIGRVGLDTPLLFPRNALITVDPRQTINIFFSLWISG